MPAVSAPLPESALRGPITRSCGWLSQLNPIDRSEENEIRPIPGTACDGLVTYVEGAALGDHVNTGVASVPKMDAVGLHAHLPRASSLHGAVPVNRDM